ncbi:MULTISPECIES: hypothetical protein [unclassified Sinorhizobium]|uniref:hypothetical protein n=1 Tax=unclassified Sinorhizobium TaxID=2613772 RepID=UPI003523E40E
MADFVAVIRRAVDGLSENTPEMRVKVYERARGAVQRQLENMKPRPPEQMLQRQLDKLEAAIREVESEHAEALPPLESEAEQEVQTASPADEEPQVAEPYSEQPQTADTYEPAPEERAEEQVAEAVDEPSRFEEPDVHEEPAYASVDEQPEAAAPEDYRDEPQWKPAEEGSEPAEEYPPEEYHAADSQARPVDQPTETVEEVAEQPAAAEARPDNVWDFPRKWPEQASEAQSYALDEETGRVAAPEAGEALSGREDEFVEHSREEPLHSDGAGHFDPVWPKPASEATTASESDWAVEELRRLSDVAPPDVQPANDDEKSSAAAKMPAAKDAFIWDPNAFDAVPPPEAGATKQPFQAQFDDIDLFADVHGNGSIPKKETPSNARLRESEQRGAYLRDADDTEGAPPDLDQLVASKLQGKSFRLEPKRRRFSIGRIVTYIVILAILGGSGYAAWLNRDALNEMVAGLVSAARQGGVAGTQAPPQQTATQNPPAPPADNSNAQGNAQSAQPQQQETAALDRNAPGSTKFTQRLMPDGSEVDVGPASIPGQPAAEGRSVAEQNVASTEAPPAASPAQPPADTTPAAPAQAAQQTPPVGSAQKLFLYEERLGQTSPIAIEGTVVWSLQHEEGADGRSEPTVQGNVSVPQRNLSALITFKRNSDSSLPASHLVEIVFQLPQNFEGGGVDSVERISMKQTEQDRGDPLIAVPAKITDDFYMVALNDYADARKANLGLLQSRNWIDMPITYRNGRRALLTMEKGQTGGDAFNTAIKEWTALGDVSSTSQ